MTTLPARAAAVARIETKLRRTASPRLQMAGIVMATAASGLLASYVMLTAGVQTMAVRYPLAVLAAYGIFLGIVRLWLRRFRVHATRQSDGSGIDVIDLDVSEVPWGKIMDPVSAEPPASLGGNGGGAAHAGDLLLSDAGGSGSSHVGDWGFDLSEGGVALVAVLAIGAIALGVVVYVVWIAPALFAELLLDAALAAGLYRRLRGVEQRSWLRTAVRRTAVAALAVAGLVAAAGAIMQSVYPDAVSIGRVVEQATTQRH